MRTTLDIDEEILAALRLAASGSGRSLSEVVNEALLAGLDRRIVKPYRTPVFAMGLPAFDADKALRFADELEAAERIHKLAQ